MAIEADDKATSTHHDNRHLGHRIGNHHTVAAVLRSSACRGGLLGCTRLQLYAAAVFMPRGVATGHRWQFVFSAGQLSGLLSATYVLDNIVLCAHLDQGLHAQHTWRTFQGRSAGPHAAEEQGEGHQNVGGRRHIVCVILAASLRDFRAYQIRLGYIAGGVRDTEEGNATCSMARILQQLHKSHTLLREQKVSKGFCGDHQVSQLLRKTQVGS